MCLLISLWFCFYRRRQMTREPLRQRAYTPLPTHYFPRDVVLYIAQWYPPAGFGRAAERLQQPLPVYHPSAMNYFIICEAPRKRPAQCVRGYHGASSDISDRTLVEHRRLGILSVP